MADADGASWVEIKSSDGETDRWRLVFNDVSRAKMRSGRMVKRSKGVARMLSGLQVSPTTLSPEEKIALFS
jgi:hypothetical protein